MKFLESFDNTELNSKLKWHCEPSNWKIENKRLTIDVDPETDFWQKTHYGFQVDNGHFLFSDVEGDFILETHAQCNFKHQYDQAGLMVRVSEECWVKASVEFEPEESNKLGAVVTNHGYSDWSTQDVEDSFTKFKLRIIRNGSTYIVQYFDTKLNEWIQIRMFHLFDQQTVSVGIYCCSPKEAGFSAHFNYLKIE